MLIPDGTAIIPFFDKYFIRAESTDEIVIDEKVRVVYSMRVSDDTDVPDVKRNVQNFDIYIKKDQSHNAIDDRLQSRGELIANKIREILMIKRYANNTGYRFEVRTEGDFATRTVGYTRYHVSFYYMRVY